MAASLIPVVVASPTPSEGINPALPEKTLMAFPEVVAMQASEESLRDPPPPPLFASTYN